MRPTASRNVVGHVEACFLGEQDHRDCRPVARPRRGRQPRTPWPTRAPRMPRARARRPATG